MWVGTQNNLTFRGVSPRIESQSARAIRSSTQRPQSQFAPDGRAADHRSGRPVPPASAGRRHRADESVPEQSADTAVHRRIRTRRRRVWTSQPRRSGCVDGEHRSRLASQPDLAALRLAPRIAPQPVDAGDQPGEEKMWNVVGMDLEGLATDQLMLHYDPHASTSSEVPFGERSRSTRRRRRSRRSIAAPARSRITSSDGKPLQFASGGEVIGLRVRGGLGRDVARDGTA